MTSGRLHLLLLLLSSGLFSSTVAAAAPAEKVSRRDVTRELRKRAALMRAGARDQLSPNPIEPSRFPRVRPSAAAAALGRRPRWQTIGPARSAMLFAGRIVPVFPPVLSTLRRSRSRHLLLFTAHSSAPSLRHLPVCVSRRLACRFWPSSSSSIGRRVGSGRQLGAYLAAAPGGKHARWASCMPALQLACAHRRRLAGSPRSLARSRAAGPPSPAARRQRARSRLHTTCTTYCNAQL